MREPIGSKYIELKGTFDTVSKMMHFLFLLFCLLFVVVVSIDDEYYYYKGKVFDLFQNLVFLSCLGRIIDNNLND